MACDGKDRVDNKKQGGVPSSARSLEFQRLLKKMLKQAHIHFAVFLNVYVQEFFFLVYFNYIHWVEPCEIDKSVAVSCQGNWMLI